MKKRTTMIRLFASVFTLTLASCGGGGGGTSSLFPSSSDSKLPSLAFDDDNPTAITVGENVSIKTNRSDVTFAGDDDYIATVSSTGEVKALHKGVLGLKVTTSGDEPETLSTYISVNPVSGISVSFVKKTATLAVGSTFQFSASVSGDSLNGGVGYLVNNSAVATIGEDGLLTALQPGKDGKVFVTAYSKSNPSAFVDQEVTITGSAAEGSLETINGYTLFFEDSFEGERLNTHNWNYMIGDGSAYGVSNGWGNGEKEFYREENVELQDGKMDIVIKKCDSDKNKGMTFTSGRIRSNGKVAYTHGRIEAKISCPFGTGIWPAFWMLPDTEGTNAYGGWPNSGEIDIMEAKGRLHYMMNGTIHYGDAEGTSSDNYKNGNYSFPDGEDINGFHTYAVEWDETEIRFYCDSNLYYTAKDWTIKNGTGTFPAPFDKPFHIIFNLAVGGNYDGYKMPSANEVPAKMQVEYVKWFGK